MSTGSPSTDDIWEAIIETRHRMHDLLVALDERMKRLEGIVNRIPPNRLWEEGPGQNGPGPVDLAPLNESEEP